MTLHAQDDPVGYAEALRRIDFVRKSNDTSLNLSDLGLTKVPPEIGQLTQLQHLNLDVNPLTTLPPEIGQLTQLQVLYLSSTSLRTLPSEIGQLINLQALYLLDNQLIELPPEIARLTQLQELSLYNNRFTELPPEIGQLTQLHFLDVSHNLLTELPLEIGQLTHLCILEISDNRLQHLPVELGNLLAAPDDCIAYGIGTDNNPLITPPPEVIAEGTPAILAYLREQAWYHTRQLLISLSGGVGFFALVILGLRWRYRRARKSKAKRGAT
jgi:hypothetical protein